MRSGSHEAFVTQHEIHTWEPYANYRQDESRNPVSRREDTRRPRQQNSPCFQGFRHSSSQRIDKLPYCRSCMSELQNFITRYLTFTSTLFRIRHSVAKSGEIGIKKTSRLTGKFRNQLMKINYLLSESPLLEIIASCSASCNCDSSISTSCFCSRST